MSSGAVSAWIRSVALAIAGGLLACANAAVAQDGTATADADMVVVTQLSLVKDVDLDFGNIIPGTSRGFVTLNPDGTLTKSGGVVQVSGEGQPAAFYGYGEYRQFLRISIDANRYFLRRVGGNETMRLDNITIGSTPPTTLSTNPRLFYIGAPDGFFRFTVGGRLRVGANQVPGTYETEFDVTVEYL